MPMRRAKVLVVEDEALISEMISEVLAENGFDVHAVPDAETALQYIQDGPEVDVLFTDINLEGRMDGSTLAQKVRNQRPEMPIVYCSGRYSSSAIAPLMPRSIFVRKPYDAMDVCTLLGRLTATSH